MYATLCKGGKGNLVSITSLNPGQAFSAVLPGVQIRFPQDGQPVGGGDPPPWRSETVSALSMANFSSDKSIGQKPSKLFEARKLSYLVIAMITVDTFVELESRHIIHQLG